MRSLDFDNWKRAQDVIAQGALTNSKHPSSLVFGVYPTHCSSANGALLFASGKPYVDYMCSLGANFLGHNNPKIIEKLKENLDKGFSHSLPTTFELDTGEALKQLFYFVDKWKFLKTGTEACMAAIRMARTKTGRNMILSEGYHGWGDEFVSLTPPAKGTTEYHRYGMHHLKDWNTPEDLWGQVAAVIVEPVMTDWSEERRLWLQALRDKCTKVGALLIFDEVITGFRFPKRCVAQYWNIIPDLIVIGKAMANGLPLSAVGGKAEIMDGGYFVSSTYAGEILSLSACQKVCELLAGSHRYDMDRLWEEGQRFMDRFNEMLSPRLSIEGYPTRGVFKGEPLDKALLFQEAIKAGILLCNSWFYNFGLVDHNHFFFTFLKDFKGRFERGEINLEGELPRSPFAERVRSGKTS